MARHGCARVIIGKWNEDAKFALHLWTYGICKWGYPELIPESDDGRRRYEREKQT